MTDVLAGLPPMGVTDELLAKLPGLRTPERKDADRSVTFSWKLYDKPSDFSRDANNAVYATLRVSHYKKSWNDAEDYFNVSLSNVERADMLDGDGNVIGKTEKFGLFQGVNIAKYPAGNRFSQKKLGEAADRALADFNKLYADGNMQVRGYFSPEATA